jgi:precorrin-6B methylase 2
MKKIIWRLLNFLRIGGPIQLAIAGYMLQTGWLKSFYTKRSVDKSGNPIPWITYPGLRFVAEKMRPELRVFEYGSGGSTRWYADRVKEIISVEHEAAWYKIVRDMGLPANVSLLQRSLNSGYSDAILEQDGTFDFVIIDGRQRNACLRAALQKLSPQGIILFDNSEVAEYAESLILMEKEGFKHLHFWGMVAITPGESCTTLFYRTNNCFAI